MKGIKLCGDCVNYDWKKHKCKIGCNDDSNAQASFYGDCPLPSVVPKAEFERLKQNNAERVEFFSALIEAEKRKGKRLKTIAEAEAIKEFARRVKATFPPREDPHCTDDDIFTLDSIDTIMNDMLSVLQNERGDKE